MDILEFVGILKEKRTVARILIAIGFFIGVLAYFILPAIYECRVTFMVLESKLIRRTLEGRKLDIDTYLDFVNNESIYRDIYDRLHIGENFDLKFEQFKKAFEVTSVEDTAIINLVVSFEDPEVCHQIAEILSQKALELNRSVIEEEIRSGHQFSERQLAQAADKLEKAKEALDHFLEKYPIQQLALKVDGLRNRIVLESTGMPKGYPPLEGMSITNTAQSTSIQMAPTFVSIYQKADPLQSTAKLEAEQSQLLAELKHTRSDNRKLELNRRLNVIADLLTVKRKRVKQLTSKLARMEAEYYPLKHQYVKLTSEFLAAQKGYVEVYRQTVETKMEVAGKTKEMTIIDPPVKPDQPIFPKLIFTVLGGLFLGILSVFVYVILVGFNRKLTHA